MTPTGLNDGCYFVEHPERGFDHHGISLFHTMRYLFTPYSITIYWERAILFKYYAVNPLTRRLVTPGLHNKVPAYNIFARGWVAQ